MNAPLRVLLLTPNLDNNSYGRTYCLWLLARHAGMTTDVAAVKGDAVWAPLAGAPIAAETTRHHLPDDGTLPPALLEQAHRADVLVAVKPVDTSFGLGLRLAETTGRPLLLDVDDPDIEVRTSWLPWYERAARYLLKPEYRRVLELGALARQATVMVSNPELHRTYGGTLVPHVRPAVPRPPVDGTRSPVVRFVGSARAHKGVDVLREAVARLADRGYRLEVTADPPPDARPWETWLGTTTFEHGQHLVATADVIALPSLRGSWTPAQLPVKLVDAMMAGRAVVASDVGPIRWALADTGRLIPPGDTDALTAALADLADPAVRERLGAAAHRRAVDTFSVDRVAPAFTAAVRSVLGSGTATGVVSAAPAPEPTAEGPERDADRGAAR